LKRYLAAGAVFMAFGIASAIWMGFEASFQGGGLQVALYIVIGALILLPAMMALNWILVGNPPGSGGLLGPWLKQFSFQDKSDSDDSETRK
jgi:hypothetical protein